MGRMKTEQISGGFITVGTTQAVVSHVRITIGDAAPYDEVAYKLGKVPWVVVASHLDDTDAAKVFAALDGAAVNLPYEIDAVAMQVLDGA